MKRRTVIKFVGLGALGISTGGIWGCVAPLRRETSERFPANDPAAPPRVLLDSYDFSPIDRLITRTKQTEFSGDRFQHPHDFLWSKEDAIRKAGGIPPISEEHQVVVVGGGMSGIISAFCLRDLNPLILEQAARLGGNSRGESWNGIDYSIGAAYFMDQEVDSPIYKLFAEAGIHQICRKKTSDDPVLYRGRIMREFWKGESDPAAKAQFEKAETLFSDIFHAKNGRYLPALPPETDKDREVLAELDHYNFRQYLEKELGSPLHPHIETLLEHYCWSTLGAGMNALSAAIAVPTYASEFGEVYVAQGGNAGVAEKFLAEFLKATSPKSVRASSLVLDVRVVGDKVEVLYEDSKGKLTRIAARAAIMACPKFIARRLIDDLEPARGKAMGRIRYTGYLVANALLRGANRSGDYDTYLLGDGTLPSLDPRVASRAHRLTDIVNANFAAPNESYSVLTLYRSLPYFTSRGELLDSNAYEKFRAEFRDQVEKEILPALGFKNDAIEEIRVTRWGHPIPVAGPGLLKAGVFDEITKPFKNRVFFVEQDNWGAPAIETCALEALKWTPLVRKL